MINSGRVKTEDLNKKTNKVEKSEEAASVIKEYEDTISTKKKKMYALRIIKENFFEKFFKETEKFIMLIKKSKVHKTTMIL